MRYRAATARERFYHGLPGLQRRFAGAVPNDRVLPDGAYKEYVVPPRCIVFDARKAWRKSSSYRRSTEPELEKAVLVAKTEGGEVQDASIGTLRNAYARDLILEEITPSTPSGQGNVEAAMYVVSKSGANVGAELGLVHQ